MRANNVILFPAPDALHGELTVDKVIDQVTKNKIDAIDTITDNVVSGLMQSLETFTIELKNNYDIGLICESVKSAIFREKGLEHPLQKAAESTIRLID